jgi:GGDEF domain-containing protein
MGDAPPDSPAGASPAAHARPEAPATDGLARAVGAAEGLSAALWEALSEELRAPEAPARDRAVAELAERLVQVSSTVALLAGRAASARGGATPAGASEAPGATFPGPQAGPLPGPQAGPLSEPPAGPFPEPPARVPEIAIHDARGEGPAAWVQAIGAGLERYARDALPFGVLLVEVLDVERLAQAEPAAELTRLLVEVEGALRRELRPPDGITLESRGRWWLTVPQADARGAWALAERLAGAVRGAVDHRGVPLEVGVGIATCPEDGRDASTLAAHADVGLYAARAAGRSLPPERAG